MDYFYRSALSAVLTVFVSINSLAQSAASSAASASVAQTAAAAKPAAPKKTTEKPPAKKYLVGVYPLTQSFGPESCFRDRLQSSATNASDVVKQLSSEPGFTFSAIAPDKVAIYSETSTKPDLTNVKDKMQQLANYNQISAIVVPPGSAEKAAAQVALPSDGSIIAKAVGSNCVLLESKPGVDPVARAAIKSDIQRGGRQLPTSPVQRLFYVDATTVAKKLSGSADSSSDTAGGGDKTSSQKPKATSQGETASSTSTASPTVSVSVAPGSTPATAKATSGGDGADSSDSADQSGQSSVDPKDSATKGSGTKPVGSDKNKSGTTTTPKPPAMTPVNDMLVYSNEDGTDRGIFERNRLMAILDLPRPEVLMNIWSLQASSKNYKAVTAEAEAAQELVAHHNDILQGAIDDGWASLSRQMTDPGFFDPLFYEYVAQKFVATNGEQTGDIQQQGKTSELETAIKSNRVRWGWCSEEKYCLGFSHAFEPLLPTLTNILIGMIAARDADRSAMETVNDMEGPPSLAKENTVCKPQPTGEDPCTDRSIVDAFRSCIARVDRQLHNFEKESSESCELDDRIAMSEQILNNQQERLKLNCFRHQAMESFLPDTVDLIAGAAAERRGNLKPRATSRAGLLRAAVADFLFNYKWATQYPHDFIPYDLAHSAQELNAEFNPLVLAFNRDVSAFTENLQMELQCKYEADISRRESRNWFKNDEGTFINDGMLSVRGISGVESIADTVTQSFFDATNPPSLTDLVKSVSDAEKNIPGVLKTNLSANEAAVLLGALNSVQPAEAKIGRELKLDITPHALAGASSAELEVKLTAEETGNPTRFTADKSSEDTLSRIAKHDVSTRVRVESTKLFEVSAFSAMLQRPRSKFPIVPPFFEVPYFGSFIGWPIPGAKVYHRSTAIVSAVIVPTAADLAFGIEFTDDRVCDGEGCHPAGSPKEFGSLQPRIFHKAMIECLASGGTTPYAGLRVGQGRAEFERNQKHACDQLSLFPPPEVKRGAGAPDNSVPPN